eukprot:CAMPEP_0172623854 /NCGR_PEP_ID=MMETSP1068-20121228/131970_1 /TAXON_ID=35684 /ORGANISM="Pseudopedinella elastica, Strain CCMP716" /LENGTH=44 /DNA_ID= /DNA_START= /DNA_END= /DNA_ORIENTATION=
MGRWIYYSMASKVGASQFQVLSLFDGNGRDPHEVKPTGGNALVA